MRDPKTGRFVKGHKHMPPRDPVTGRFISLSDIELVNDTHGLVTDSKELKYLRARAEVDEFLRAREEASR